MNIWNAWNISHLRYVFQGHESFVSHESMEQLHRFLFVLGTSHVFYSFVAIALAMIKVIQLHSIVPKSNQSISSNYQNFPSISLYASFGCRSIAGKCGKIKPRWWLFKDQKVNWLYVDYSWMMVWPKKKYSTTILYSFLIISPSFVIFLNFIHQKLFQAMKEWEEWPHSYLTTHPILGASTRFWFGW